MALGGFQLNTQRGLLWGLAGFVCFAAVPAVGLPPMPPGVPQADVAARQLWWVLTVLCTATGLLLVLVTRGGWLPRIAGALLLLVPHLIGAPRTAGIQIAPADLVRAFTIASLAGNCFFWIVLGAVSGFFFRSRPVPGRT